MSGVTVKTTETELPKSSEAHIILPHDSYHMTWYQITIFSDDFGCALLPNIEYLCFQHRPREILTIFPNIFIFLSLIILRFKDYTLIQDPIFPSLMDASHLFYRTRCLLSISHHSTPNMQDWFCIPYIILQTIFTFHEKSDE